VRLKLKLRVGLFEASVGLKAVMGWRSGDGENRDGSWGYILDIHCWGAENRYF